MRVEPVLEPVDVLLRTGLPAVVGHRDVVVDPVGRRARVVDDDAAEREHDDRDRGGEEKEDERTASPRGSRRRCRSRTSGLSRNAITAATRKRKMAWPRIPASIQTIRSPTGRPTSWIQRGTRMIGPEGSLIGRS